MNPNMSTPPNGHIPYGYSPSYVGASLVPSTSQGFVPNTNYFFPTPNMPMVSPQIDFGSNVSESSFASPEEELSDAFYRLEKYINRIAHSSLYTGKLNLIQSEVLRIRGSKNPTTDVKRTQQRSSQKPPAKEKSTAQPTAQASVNRSTTPKSRENRPVTPKSRDNTPNRNRQRSKSVVTHEQNRESAVKGRQRRPNVVIDERNPVVNNERRNIPKQQQSNNNKQQQDLPSVKKPVVKNLHSGRRCVYGNGPRVIEQLLKYGRNPTDFHAVKRLNDEQREVLWQCYLADSKKYERFADMGRDGMTTVQDTIEQTPKQILESVVQKLQCGPSRSWADQMDNECDRTLSKPQLPDDNLVVGKSSELEKSVKSDSIPETESPVSEYENTVAEISTSLEQAKIQESTELKTVLQLDTEPKKFTAKLTDTKQNALTKIVDDIVGKQNQHAAYWKKCLSGTSKAPVHKYQTQGDPSKDVVNIVKDLYGGDFETGLIPSLVIVGRVQGNSLEDMLSIFLYDNKDYPPLCK